MDCKVWNQKRLEAAMLVRVTTSEVRHDFPMPAMVGAPSRHVIRTFLKEDAHGGPPQLTMLVGWHGSDVLVGPGEPLNQLTDYELEYYIFVRHLVWAWQAGDVGDFPTARATQAAFQPRWATVSITFGGADTHETNP